MELFSREKGRMAGFFWPDSMMKNESVSKVRMCFMELVFNEAKIAVMMSFTKK